MTEINYKFELEIIATIDRLKEQIRSYLGDKFDRAAEAKFDASINRALAVLDECRNK